MPETRYAKTVDGVHIAYQVRGEGPVDLVYVTGFAGNFEIELEEPYTGPFYRRLEAFSRLILFDKRGTGLSDRSQTPDLEMRADDLRAVLDAAGSKRAVLFGESEGGALAAFFAATHPERVQALILYGTRARYSWAPDYPAGMTAETFAAERKDFVDKWGTEELAVQWLRDEAPSIAEDPETVREFARLLRHSATPAAAVEFFDMWHAIDVRSVLGSVQAPTAVFWREGVDDPGKPTKQLADLIPGARYVELPGRDYIPMVGRVDELLHAIESFVKSVSAEEAETDRVLATVLFTDIVGSTEKAAEIGDAAWRSLLERHHQIVRALIGRYRGREVDTAGDGFLVTFDGPARAIRCATAVVASLRRAGIEIRAGLHTGECELVDDKVRGIAVHIGARVAGLAQGGEVLVSSTVKDLVAGSGLAFEDRGVHALKGVPDEWRIFAVQHFERSGE
jgi:class 3 adenylate cyclase